MIMNGTTTDTGYKIANFIAPKIRMIQTIPIRRINIHSGKKEAGMD